MAVGRKCRLTGRTRIVYLLWVTIGERLEAIIRDKGVTKAEVARRAGLTRQAVSNICAGNEPSVDTVRRLAAALDVTEGALIDGTETPPKNEETKAAVIG